MNRRVFLGLSPLGAASLLVPRSALAAPAVTGPANKRERMLQWLAGKTDPNYTPAAFFLHFGPGYKNGSAAAKRHLEFFRQTDMDFVKIQFEQTYERQEFLQKPSDWSKLTLRKVDFYEPLVETVRELVKSSKKDALILMTLYSPFMGAGQCATAPVLKRHLEENPEAVKRGLEILSESQLIFVRACVKAGVDGFYMSTQGSEKDHFTSPKIFADYVKPYDLVAMKEASAACPFNILHVCDYVAPYANYDVTLDYPGQVVNCNTKLTGGQISPQEIAKLFKRPYMGGMDRHGILAKGTPAEVEAEIRRVVKGAPSQFILGADCTVEAETDWNRIRHAIGVAHRVGNSRG
jgi:uroporphyrinogen decarboxylase